VVGALLLYPDGRVQHAGMSVGVFYAADNRRPRGPGGAIAATQDQAAVTGACLLVRAEVLRELGGLEESMRVSFADIDLCLRARARGYKVLLAARAVLRHHESATRDKGPPDPHPWDTYAFRSRHADCILSWDLFSSPLSARDAEGMPARGARAGERAPTRHVPVVLADQATSNARTARSA
jgi:O-antigen biosynthesis protein